MEGDRDFNPVRYVVQGSESSDSDEDSETEMVVGDPVSWNTVPIELRETLDNVWRLDGIICISDSMKIANFPGVFHVRKFPPVYDNRLTKYKGFEAFLGLDTKHVYEFSLGAIGGLDFCAIIATSHTVPFSKQPKYFRMVKSYHEAIRRCITHLHRDTLTAGESLLRTDLEMHIYLADWGSIAEALPARLMAIIQEDQHKDNFPDSPRFYWCAKQFGQNLIYSPESCAASMSLYQTSIRLCGNYCVAVHCALDITLRDHILFWNPTEIGGAWGRVRPKEVFHVGLIPGLANVTYQHDGSRGISFVQYYTKLFSSAHRDRNNFFMKNEITKKLFARYTSKLQKNINLKLNQKDRIVNDANGELAAAFLGIEESSKRTTFARIEAVWSATIGFQDMNRVIAAAFNDVEWEFRGRNMPLYDDKMLTNIKASDYSGIISEWIPYFYMSIAELSAMVQGLEKETNLWIMDPDKVINHEAFLISEVVETIVHVLLRGKLSKGYPSTLGKYLGFRASDLNNSRHFNQLREWPFERLRREDNHLQPRHLEELEALLPFFPRNPVINKCTAFLNVRRNFLAAQSPQRRDMEVFGEELATFLVELILYFQLKLTDPQIADNITLSMTFNQPKKGRRLEHVTCMGFLNQLSSKYQRGELKQHHDLFAIMKKLSDEILRWKHFKELVCKKVDNLIGTQGYPFRFTYGEHTEIVVHSGHEGYPIPNSVQRSFKRGVVTLNQGKTSSVGANASHLADTYLKWTADNKSSECMVKAATAIQMIFDKGSCPTLVCQSLRQTLLTAFRGQGEHPMPPPPPPVQLPSRPSTSGESSPSQSNVPLRQRLLARSNGTAQQVPEPIPGPSTGAQHEGGDDAASYESDVDAADRSGLLDTGDESAASGPIWRGPRFEDNRRAALYRGSSSDSSMTSPRSKKARYYHSSSPSAASDDLSIDLDVVPSPTIPETINLRLDTQYRDNLNEGIERSSVTATQRMRRYSKTSSANRSSVSGNSGNDSS